MLERYQPRLLLGPYQLVMATTSSEAQSVWALPGGQRITYRELQRLAACNRWRLEFVKCRVRYSA